MGQSTVYRNTEVVELNGPFSPLQQLVGVGKSFELRQADCGLGDRAREDSGEKETYKKSFHNSRFRLIN